MQIGTGMPLVLYKKDKNEMSFMNDAFAKAWYLLKQIRLTPDERQLRRLSDERNVSSGLGDEKPMLQSNLGLFDPKLALTGVSREDMGQVPIRIGLGKRKEINKPSIESQYVLVENKPGHKNYQLMGIPANGGPHVIMSELKGNIEYEPNFLSSLNAETPKMHQRQGNYEKLLQAILASGMGVISDNRNRRYSNPFHRKFLSNYGHLYSPDDIKNLDELKTSDEITYNPPSIRNGKTVIEQKPQEGMNPKGGFGSLARYDFGALPMRRKAPEYNFTDRNPDALKTEQTLFTEGYLANANRGRPYPQNIYDFMLYPNIRPHTDQNISEEIRQQVPNFDASYSKTLTPADLAIGASSTFPNHPSIYDLNTFTPVLVAQPRGNIAQGVGKNKLDDFTGLGNLFG